MYLALLWSGQLFSQYAFALLFPPVPGCSIVTVVLCFLLAMADAPNGPPSRDDLIDSALVRLVSQDYRAAGACLDGVLRVNSRDADALYLRLAVHQTELLDYESYAVHGEDFLAHADSVLAILEEDVHDVSGRDSLRYLLYLGNIHGGKAIVRAKNGNWLRAIKPSLLSVRLLRSVKERDPGLHAACLGIGLFDYYISRNFKWVPFMEDHTEKGLADIRRATRAPFPFNYGARDVLAWILIDRRQLKKAEAVVDEVLRELPGNTIFLRIKARIAYWSQDYEGALAHGRALVELSRRRDPVNWSDLLSGYRIMVSSLDVLGRSECVDLAREALSLSVPTSAMNISHVREHLAAVRAVAEKRGKRTGAETE